MRLDIWLVTHTLFESRKQAQVAIQAGNVLVSGKVVTKPSHTISHDAIVTVTKTQKYVSRGGDKLEGALQHIYGESVAEAIKDTVCLDVGSSTGGFTDCLLQHGAAKVIAVDVGTEQLHQRLRSDSRVELHEKTDIRTFKTSTRFNLVVADLSFISLDDVLDILLNHASEHTDFFLLLKPQFEVGKGNTKKGIVKREELVTEVMRNYTSYLESKGVSSLTLFPCSIKGGDGNQEYFIFFSL